MESSLTISFSREKISGISGVLKIKQEPWKSDTGMLTKSDFYVFVKNLLESSIFGNPVDCGFNPDGSITTTIYVYLEDPDFLYSLKTSYGVLGSKYGESASEEEMIQFSSSNTANLNFIPENGSVSYSWLGDTYNLEGDLVENPSVSIDGSQVELSYTVFGSLKVTYSAFRHVYNLTAYPREDADENLFSAVVYALYEGGIDWLELSNPPNVDEISLYDNCGWGSMSIEESENISAFNPPTVEQSNITYVYDYCSQELIEVINRNADGLETVGVVTQ